MATLPRLKTERLLKCPKCFQTPMHNSHTSASYMKGKTLYTYSVWCESPLHQRQAHVTCDDAKDAMEGAINLWNRHIVS